MTGPDRQNISRSDLKLSDGCSSFLTSNKRTHSRWADDLVSATAISGAERMARGGMGTVRMTVVHVAGCNRTGGGERDGSRGADGRREFAEAVGAWQVQLRVCK